MGKFILLLAFVTVAPFVGMRPAQAGTQQQCLKEIEQIKQVDKIRENAFAVFQESGSERDRCAYVKKAKAYFSQAKQAALSCQEHEPQLASNLLTESTNNLKKIESSEHQCNSVKENRSQNEEKCRTAMAETDNKNILFKNSLENYNNNKTNDTRCIFLAKAFDYFSSTIEMNSFCKIFRPSKGQHNIKESQNSLNKIKIAQKKYCA